MVRATISLKAALTGGLRWIAVALLTAVCAALGVVGPSGPTADADGGLKLPWPAGVTYEVSQTWNSGYHTGYNA